MAKLPVVSGKKVATALEKAGWMWLHKWAVMRYSSKKGWRKHNGSLHKTVAKGTLRNIIRKANVTVEDFVKLL